MKLLLETLDFNNIDSDDAVVFGIDMYSHNMAMFIGFNQITLDYLHEIPNQKFIYLNNLIDNNSLHLLNELLSMLSGTGIKVIFEDYAILNLCKKHQYQIDLYLGQVGAVTSSALINNSDELIKGALITPNMAFDDITSIINHSNKELILFGYGYLNIYYSKRPVVSNYLNTFDIDTNPVTTDVYNIEIVHKEKAYILEQASGISTILSDKIYNLVNELSKLDLSKIKYFYCSSRFIDEKVFETDINNIKHVINNPSFQIDLNDNYSTYQFYNPNYYKVKHYE